MFIRRHFINLSQIQQVLWQFTCFKALQCKEKQSHQHALCDTPSYLMSHTLVSLCSTRRGSWITLLSRNKPPHSQKVWRMTTGLTPESTPNRPDSSYLIIEPSPLKRRLPNMGGVLRNITCAPSSRTPLFNTKQPKRVWQKVDHTHQSLLEAAASPVR